MAFSKAESWNMIPRVVWHNIFVVMHEVSSGGPAVVLLVLDLFNAMNTKGFLCQNMRHFLG